MSSILKVCCYKKIGLYVFVINIEKAKSKTLK